MCKTFYEGEGPGSEQESSIPGGGFSMIAQLLGWRGLKGEEGHVGRVMGTGGLMFLICGPYKSLLDAIP